MNITMPTKHQIAVAGSHAVVFAGGAIAALSFAGVLSPAQVATATDDVKRISADIADLIGAISSLGALFMVVYSTLKSGPLASFFRAAVTISQNPDLTKQVQDASIVQKAPVVFVTDKMPEVAGVGTTDTKAGAELALAVPSPTVQVAGKIAVVILALALSALVSGSVHAQKLKTPQQIGQDIKNGFEQTNATVKSAVTGQADPKAALPCMDITMLTKLTIFNIVSTIKGCEQDGIKQLISDSSRALDSAMAYVGPNGGAPGDGDGIACHKPALALWKVALIVPAHPDIPANPGSPAVEAVPAVLNADGSIKTPAIIAVPAVPATAAIPAEPELVAGPILIGQKFSEFVKSGGITSCKTWLNNQINAVASAAAGAVGDVIAGTALIPK